jgi:hypothetical protein
MPRHEPTTEEQYRPSLVSLMRFRDGINYAKDQQFSRAQLGSIQPEELVRWMKRQVYGNPDAGQNDNPTHGRSSTLEYMKKAVSFFMPNRLMPWNVMANPPVGNPTKSIDVNNLIKLVKKKEVRKQGKPSQARHAFEEREYEHIIKTLEANEDVEIRLFSSAIMRFQLSMIARIDDSAKLRVDNLKTNPQHIEFSILSKLCWSKNVQEERDAPDQILMGAMNKLYCVLIGLATWLEYWIDSGYGQNNEFVFGLRGIDDPVLIKERASAALKRLINNPDLMGQFLEEKRGTHSNRKFATTRARRNGCLRDETDWRARWRRSSQQDSYADVTVPWPDAKVAAALCKGGPIHYLVKQNSGISEQWILDYVVPAIRSRFSRPVSLVLGRALLWRVFDDEDYNIVPVPILTRVRNAYRDLGPRCQLAAGENPVQKVPLMVTGADAEVYIDLMLDDDGNDAGGGVDGRRGNQELRHVNNLLIGVRRDNAELRVEMTRINAVHTNQLRTINRNILQMMNTRRYVRNDQNRNNQNALQLGDAAGANGNAAAEQEGHAILSRCPKTLHALWSEYEFGVGGKKPAKDFSPQERGRFKNVYSKRKLLWDKVAEMVRSGYDCNGACNKIYQVYGADRTVTQIIALLRRDKPNGGHPSLRTGNL